MTERLTRALQAGGAVSQLQDGRYGVWRGRDKRGRVIGYLSEEQVQRWRLSDMLIRYGDGIPTVWVWRPGDDRALACMPRAKQALRILDYVDKNAAYLPRLLLFRSGRQGEAMIIRVQAFRDDYARIHVAAGLSSMDWRGLGYGVRIDRSRQIAGVDGQERQCTARRRLRALRQALGDADWQTWLRISVHLWSLKDFERRGHITAATVSQRLPRLIGALDEIYAAVTMDVLEPGG